MNNKLPINFAFSNGLKAKKLNINTEDAIESHSFDICNEIDDLISENDNVSKNITYQNTHQNDDLNSNYKEFSNYDFLKKSQSNAILVEKPINVQKLEKEKNNSINAKEEKYKKDTDVIPIPINIKKDCHLNVTTSKLDERKEFVLPKFNKFKLDCKNLHIKNEDLSSITKLHDLLTIIEKEKNENILKIKEQDLLLNMKNEEITKLQNIFLNEQKSKYELMSSNIEKSVILNKINNSNESIKIIENNVNFLDTMIRKIHDENQNEIKNNKNKIEELNYEKQNIIENNVKINKKMQSDIENHIQNIKNLNVEIEKLDTSNKDLSKILSDLKTKINFYEKEIALKNNELSKYQEESIATNSMIQKMKATAENENKNIKQKELEFDSLVNLNNSIKLDLIEARQKIKDQEYFKIKITELELEQRKLLDCNIELNDEKNFLKERCDELELNCDNLELKYENRFSKIRGGVSIVKTSVNSLKNEISMLFKILNNIKTGKEISLMKNSYEAIYENEMKRFKREKTEFMIKIENLNAENRKLKKKIAGKSQVIEPSDSDIWNVFH